MGRSYPRSTPRPNLILCKSRTLLPENKNHFASKPVTPPSRHHCSRSVLSANLPVAEICASSAFFFFFYFSFILHSSRAVNRTRTHITLPGQRPPEAERTPLGPPFPSSHQTCTNNIQLKLTKSPTGSRDFPPSSNPRFRRLQTLRHDYASKSWL